MPGLKRLVPPNRSKNERSVMEQLERYRSVTYRGEFERLAKSKLREPPRPSSTPHVRVHTCMGRIDLDAPSTLVRRVGKPAQESLHACQNVSCFGLQCNDCSFVCEDFGEENCRLWRKMQQLFSPQAPPFPSSPLSLSPTVPSPKFKTKLNPGNQRLQYSYAENMLDESKS